MCIGELWGLWGSLFRALDLILPAPKQDHTFECLVKPENINKTV